MRILTTVVSLSILLTMFSCGDADVGFNIGQVVPVEFPVDLEGVNDPLLNNPLGQANPPAYSISENFDLSDVTSDTDLVQEVVINGLAYKIEGVESNEDFSMDEFTILVEDGNTVILDLTVFSNGDPIANQTKIDAAGFNSSALTAALEANRTVTVTTIVDFAEIPTPIDFDFTFFFDVVAKVRQ